MKLYHVTSLSAARQIIQHGFIDGHLAGLACDDASRACAVSLLDVPATVQDGAVSDEACIEVEVPDEVCEPHELMEEIHDEERGSDVPSWANAQVTEWSMPAGVLNQYPRRLLTNREHMRLAGKRRAPLFRRVDFEG